MRYQLQEDMHPWWPLERMSKEQALLTKQAKKPQLQEDIYLSASYYRSETKKSDID